MNLGQPELVSKVDQISYTHSLLNNPKDPQDPVFDENELIHSFSSKSWNSDAMELDMNNSQDYWYSGIRSKNLVFEYLDDSLLEEVFEYVDQFDLVNLLLVNSRFYHLASKRLYKRVTVILNAEFAVSYQKDANLFIRENGIKFMDSSLILEPHSLVLFLKLLYDNPHIIKRIKYFVFDKCNSIKVEDMSLSHLQTQIIDYFGRKSSDIHFLHITFIDFMHGIEKLTNFLRNDNVRNKVFKLFVTSLIDLKYPKIPQALTNLFLMLDEAELMRLQNIDLSSDPYNVLYSLSTLTCSTSNQFGLEILSTMQLVNPDLKLNLKGLTIFHCHKENVLGSTDEIVSTNGDTIYSREFQDYLKSMNKRLEFSVLEEKVNLVNLSNLYLKIDCNEHRLNQCDCLPKFLTEFTKFSEAHGGLPNLTSFELELFPNLEWLRPHQILEDNLVPASDFITSLKGLSRLTIDLSTPGFKMFDNSMGMSSVILNRLNERLMEAFFLRFMTAGREKSRMTLKALQLPDFLTSFIYYKPDFYQSLLHTCRCWGCQHVLDKLKELFHPLLDDDDDDESDNDDEDYNVQSTYYILIGFILGKLQADREVCVPIKQKTLNYKNYPIYKGSPNTLHNHFHSNTKKCKCKVEEDPNGENDSNIDNLVTIYIVHQLRPIANFIPKFFLKLENLMIHGIYYEAKGLRMVPIFDSQEYPESFLQEMSLYYLKHLLEPLVAFGEFKG